MNLHVKLEKNYFLKYQVKTSPTRAISRCSTSNFCTLGLVCLVFLLLFFSWPDEIKKWREGQKERTTQNSPGPESGYAHNLAVTPKVLVFRGKPTHNKTEKDDWLSQRSLSAVQADVWTSLAMSAATTAPTRTSHKPSAYTATSASIKRTQPSVQPNSSSPIKQHHPPLFPPRIDPNLELPATLHSTRTAPSSPSPAV